MHQYHGHSLVYSMSVGMFSVRLTTRRYHASSSGLFARSLAKSWFTKRLIAMNSRVSLRFLRSSPDMYPLALGCRRRCQLSCRAMMASSSPTFDRYVEMVTNIAAFLIFIGISGSCCKVAEPYNRAGCPAFVGGSILAHMLSYIG